MYLSRFQLDTARRSTMRALASPNLFHGAIEQSFAGERQHPLWRIDQLHGGHYLMLLSEDKPELANAVRQFGDPALGWETKCYDPLLERIQPGSRWHFRLTANPTYSRPGKLLAEGKRERGRVCAHKTTAHQMEWLEKKQAPKHGFLVHTDEFTVTHSQWQHFRKGTDGGKKVTLLAVTYEGVLTVLNAERFRETLCNGIGREKAYGMGLLTVVKYHG